MVESCFTKKVHLLVHSQGMIKPDADVSSPSHPNPGQERASHIPPDRAAPQRSQAYIIERPNGIRK